MRMRRHINCSVGKVFLSRRDFLIGAEHKKIYRRRRRRRRWRFNKIHISNSHVWCLRSFPSSRQANETRAQSSTKFFFCQFFSAIEKLNVYTYPLFRCARCLSIEYIAEHWTQRPAAKPERSNGDKKKTLNEWTAELSPKIKFVYENIYRLPRGSMSFILRVEMAAVFPLSSSPEHILKTFRRVIIYVLPLYLRFVEINFYALNYVGSHRIDSLVFEWAPKFSSSSLSLPFY